MTPGPVEADPRVLRAMGAHILGQFDPEFTALMNETMEMERYVFQTQNKMTYLVDTTSRGGLETVLTGAICPGDKVLIPAFDVSDICLQRFWRDVEQISHFLRENGELYLSRKRLKRH